TGSSGGMEAEGALMIVKEIFERHGVRVTQYLGDGDSRAFKYCQEEALKISQDWIMVKLECVNHVAKRIYYNLNVRKGELRNVNVDPESAKTGIGGKNLLTDLAMKKIQSYYSWIIHSSNGDIQVMK